MNKETTERQGKDTRKRIVSFIVDYISQHGYAPTIREIGEGSGLRSTSSVNAHMRRLFADGKLETDAQEGTPRAIRVPGYRFVKEE